MQQEWDYFARNTGNLNSDGHAAQMRLRGARAAAKAGRYAEALEGFIWFHENEENDPGNRGMRLSFALRDWMKLASVYHPARIALEKLRDRKTKSLLKGFRDVEFFRDVVSVNEYLGCDQAEQVLASALESFESSDVREAVAAAIKAAD